MVTVGVLGSVGMNLRSVDRDNLSLDQASFRAEPQDLTEQAGQSVLVALAEPGDRAVIRHLVRGDHAIGDILDAAALDHPRGALPARVGVKQQRDHHPRIVRRATMPISAISGVERSEVHLLDRRQHEPREVILRQPIPHARRQQQLLITITRQEVLRRPAIVPSPPDTPAPATASVRCGSAPLPRACGDGLLSCVPQA